MRENNQAALEMLERAVGIEPNFAPAHATMALACVVRFFFDPGQPIWEQRSV